MRKHKIISGLSILFLVSCGSSSSDSESPGSSKNQYALATQSQIMACGVRPDQSRTLYEPLSQLPTPVVIDPNFSQEDTIWIQEALEEWNRVGLEKLGTEIFREVGGYPPSYAFQKSPESLCLQGIIPATNLLPIAKVDDLGFGKYVPAVTHRCGDGTNLRWQTIQISPSMLKDRKYTRAAILHELGHSIGLNHSCDHPKEKNKISVGCWTLPRGHEYLQAVMNPELDSQLRSRATSRVPDILQPNDELRATCRYRAHYY